MAVCHLSVSPSFLLNISSVFWLCPPLSASHPTLLSPHMGFAFGFPQHFLNVILWYIIWSHLLPVTTSHVDTSWVSQGEAVRFCPGELWPFNLTLFAAVIIYNAWKCNQNTNGACVGLSLSFSLGACWWCISFHPLLLPVVNRLRQRCVCACVREQKVRNFGGQLRSFR